MLSSSYPDSLTFPRHFPLNPFPFQTQPSGTAAFSNQSYKACTFTRLFLSISLNQWSRWRSTAVDGPEMISQDGAQKWLSSAIFYMKPILWRYLCRLYIYIICLSLRLFMIEIPADSDRRICRWQAHMLAYIHTYIM